MKENNTSPKKPPKKVKKRSQGRVVKKTKPDTSSIVDTRSGLTIKELKFCQEYILDFQAPRAARDSGISQESKWAYKLLKRKLIQEEIERLSMDVGKGLKIKAREIAAGLWFIAKKCSQKGKGNWNPRAAVQALSRLGAYTGGFREETNVNHKVTLRENGPDFSKMDANELKEYIQKKRAARELRAKS